MKHGQLTGETGVGAVGVAGYRFSIVLAQVRIHIAGSTRSARSCRTMDTAIPVADVAVKQLLRMTA